MGVKYSRREGTMQGEIEEKRKKGFKTRRRRLSRVEGVLSSFLWCFLSNEAVN